MFVARCIVVLIALFSAFAGKASAAQTADLKWRPLFDGKTLDGWHHFGEGQWVVEDGAIVGRTQTAAKLYSLLISDDVFHDFTVRFKFKSIKGNSGFYIRTVFGSPDLAHGLQIEVDPRAGSGGIYESYARGWVCKPPSELLATYFKQDDWNEVTIAAYGGDIKVTVNGLTSAELKADQSRPAGQLAMQMHAGNDMLVMFKGIEILGEPKKTPDKTGPTTPQAIHPQPDHTLVLHARHARLTGTKLAYMPEWDALGFWRDEDQAEWDVRVGKPGTYDVFMEWSVEERRAGNPFVLVAGSQRLEGKVQSTKLWNLFRREKIGQIKLDPGPQKVTLKPNGRFESSLMDLREVRLVPGAAQPK